MDDVTKGFRDGRFLSLTERDRKDLLRLIARIAEQAYRRGAQQGAGLAHRPWFRADLGEWRYTPSLDVSPWVDSPRMTTSLERLDGECGEDLRRLGFPLEHALPPRWPIASRRAVWTGYTREQRSSFAASGRSP